MPRLSFDALRLGQRFRGPGRTLTETDHTLFSMLVADWHPIHADAEYAKQTPAGARMIHGSFGLALAMAGTASILDFEEPVVAALGIDEWRFLRPLLIGDTVRVEVEVLDTRRTEKTGRLLVDRMTRLLNQRDETVQEGRSTVMLRPAREAE